MRHFFRPLFTAALLAAAALPAVAQQHHTLRFTSADGDRVTFATTALNAGPLTYEAWVNYSAPQVIASFTTLFEYGNDNRALFLGTDGIISTYGGSSSISTNGPLALQGWHHVAFTYDDNTTQCVFYVDGIQAGTGLASFPTTTDTELGIGAHSSDAGWQGEMDEVLVWHSARTIAQVQADMRGLVTGTETDLIAYFKFDDGAGQTVANRKSGGPTGVLGESTAVEQNDPQWTNNNFPLAAPAAVAAPTTALSVYPNPATTTVHVSYFLREAVAVRLLLFDATGRLVATLHDGAEVPGDHTAELPAGLPVGVYTCRLTAGATATAQRLVLTE